VAAWTSERGSAWPLNWVDKLSSPSRAASRKSAACSGRGMPVGVPGRSRAAHHPVAVTVRPAVIAGLPDGRRRRVPVVWNEGYFLPIEHGLDDVAHEIKPWAQLSVGAGIPRRSGHDSRQGGGRRGRRAGPGWRRTRPVR